jgi:hypothetical protein
VFVVVLDSHGLDRPGIVIDDVMVVVQLVRKLVGDALSATPEA